MHSNKRRLKLIEFGGIPGAGKSYMANKLASTLKEKLGYYPAPIFEWNGILENIPVLEDFKFKSNNYNKLSFLLFKRFGLDLFCQREKLLNNIMLETKNKYEKFHLDINDFQKKSNHAKEFSKDAELLSNYLLKLIQYFYYIENNTNRNCLILSEGFGKHSTHIVAHQKKNNSDNRNFIHEMPKISAFFYLDVNIDTALNRKKNQNGFYKDYTHDDAMKLLNKSKNFNSMQIKYLEENNVPVFVVNNEDFTASFDFVLKQTKKILFNK